MKTLKKIFKKFAVVLCAAMCLTLAGCDSGYAKNDYNADKKISSSADKYSSTGWDLKNSFGDMEITSTTFSGRQTLWSKRYDESEKNTSSATISLSAGKAKIVHIDSAGKVTTIAECSVEDKQKSGSVELMFTKGDNKFKLVGYDCKDVKISLSI